MIPTSHPKIAKHVHFNEGMNDLPLDEIPQNVVHLQHMHQGGEPFPAEEHESSADDFQFQLNPYTHSFTGTVKVSCDRENFGITIGHDEINGHAFIKYISKGGSISKIWGNPKMTNNKIFGAFILWVNGKEVFPGMMSSSQPLPTCMLMMLLSLILSLCTSTSCRGSNYGRSSRNMTSSTLMMLMKRKSMSIL
jgi:hypothetical protein